jgi:hypothetical protein
LEYICRKLQFQQGVDLVPLKKEMAASERERALKSPFSLWSFSAFSILTQKNNSEAMLKLFIKKKKKGP